MVVNDVSPCVARTVSFLVHELDGRAVRIKVGELEPERPHLRVLHLQFIQSTMTHQVTV